MANLYRDVSEGVWRTWSSRSLENLLDEILVREDTGRNRKCWKGRLAHVHNTLIRYAIIFKKDVNAKENDI